MVSFKQVAGQFKKYKTDVALRNLGYNLITRERRRSFGDLNADKTFYVIRSVDDMSPLYIGPRHNLLANYFYVLSHLAYAREKGWIPVVDMLNYPVYNSLPEPVNGTRNAWEYFWEQPSEYTLKEVYQSKNVVLSKRNWYGQWDMGYGIANYYDKDTVRFYHGLSEFVPLNAVTREYISRLKAEKLCSDLRILGVSARFGGHSQLAFRAAPGHPKQPDIADVLEAAKRRSEEWGADKLFIASDYGDAVQAFREAFGDRLIYTERSRTPLNAAKMPDARKAMYFSENIWQTSLDYLAEMELLSECSSLLGSVNSGLRYAVVRNGGKYEYMEILDCGLLADNRMRGDGERK